MENADYLLHKFVEQVPSGAKHKTDYYVSVGMAKELAMVENNDKGSQARKYFIECEKRLKEQTAPQPTPLSSIVKGWQNTTPSCHVPHFATNAMIM